MNKYEFNVSLFGNVTLEVMAESQEIAEKMVRDMMNNININDIKNRQSENKDIEISNDSLKMQISDKTRQMNYER